jgi:hypothetical protein
MGFIAESLQLNKPEINASRLINNLPPELFQN